MNRATLAYLFDRLLASDPALDRLKSGLRAVLTASLSAGAFLFLTRWAGLQYKLALAGIVVPMMAVVALQDPGRGRQQMTLMWVPVVAAAALVVGAWIAHDPWLGGGCFVLTIFAAFQARRFGPRGAGLGAIAYQSFFYAMLFKNPPDKVTWVILFVFTGCAIAYAVHFWLVPEHPGRMLHSELRAFRARIRALLHDLARWLEQDGKAAAGRIDTHLAALGAQSLALDARLAGFAGDPQTAAGLRGQVLHVDLAAETVAAVARTLEVPDARRALAGRVRALHVALSTSTSAPAAALADAAASMPAAQAWRLSRAFATLAGTKLWHTARPPMRDEHRAPPAPAQPPAPTHGSPGFDDTTRRALQACAAALGALLAGRAISPQHWYWAVFAAFVVFTRTATVGQTLSGAWRQVLAAGVGLGLGVGFAELVHGNRTLELTLLFVFVAMGFYAFRGLQNAYTVLLTAMLAMLYELLGLDSANMLVIRLEDTVAGAAVAVLAARVVLPVHTRDESGARSAALLRAAGALLDAALADPPRAPLQVLVRDVDRALQALRQSLGPVTATIYPAAKAHRRLHLDRLARIAYCVRHLAALADKDDGAHVRSDAFRTAIAVVHARLEGVARMLEAAARPAQPGANLARLAPVDAAAAGGEHVAADAAAALLTEADALVRALQARLTAPA